MIRDRTPDPCWARYSRFPTQWLWKRAIALLIYYIPTPPMCNLVKMPPHWVQYRFLEREQTQKKSDSEYHKRAPFPRVLPVLLRSVISKPVLFFQVAERTYYSSPPPPPFLFKCSHHSSFIIIAKLAIEPVRSKSFFSSPKA